METNDRMKLRDGHDASGAMDQCCENTDRELWREREGDFYADSIHVTAQGGIGINCGGYVFVKPIREWFELAGGKGAFENLLDSPPQQLEQDRA